MATPQTPAVLTIGSLKAIGIQDANSAIALGTTTFYQSPSSALLIPGEGIATQIAQTATLQNAESGNANGTTFTVDGLGTAVLQVVPSTSPAFTGTVNFEASADGGTTWVARTGSSSAAGTFAKSVTSPTVADVWTFNVAGFTSIRARTSGVTAGTVTVTGRAVPFNETAKQIESTLAGRNVTENTIFNALAINDTTPHISLIENVYQYQKLGFYAYSTLDQSVAISLQIGGQLISSGSLETWTGAAFAATTITIPVSAFKLAFTLKDLGVDVQQFMPYQLLLVAACASQPSAGSLSIVSWGVPN